MAKSSALQSLTFQNGSGSKQKEITLDYKAVTGAAMTLRALNHNLRKKMLKLINDHEKLNVKDIFTKLRLQQSEASQHLAILRRAGIVTSEKEGKQRLYSLNKDRLADIADMVGRLAQ